MVVVIIVLVFLLVIMAVLSASSGMRDEFRRLDRDIEFWDPFEFKV